MDNKNSRFKFNVLVLVACISILFSALLIFAGDKPESKGFATCKNDCPDGRIVKCEGTRVSSIDDSENPGCRCDGKDYRCSDLENNSNANSNTDTNGKTKDKTNKKKKNRKRTNKD